MVSAQECGEDFRRLFRRRTASSRAYRDAHHRCLADSRAVAGFRRSLSDVTYPIVGDRAAGSRVWDTDGNEYVDLAMGFGVQLFGHDAPFIRDALARQLENGLYLGPQARAAGEVARRLCEMTGFERVCFCNTGSEAVMTALRLARAASGRDRIAMFKWSYHGHFDGTLGRPRSGRRRDETMPLAAGISPRYVDNLLMLDYGEPAAFDALDRHAGEIAAVIVEPVQSLRPDLQPKDFLEALARWTEANRTVLIFDEILLGFRIHQRGALGYFGVKPDLATYGKILGGGLPIGVVAGRSNILRAIDGGPWPVGGEPAAASQRTFFAGTFNKNPLGMAAAEAVLTHLELAGPELQAGLNRRTDRFAAGLNAWFESRGLPLRIVNFGSLFRISGSANLEPLFYGLLNRGVYVWEGRSCFLSTAHSDGDLELVAAAIREAALEWQAGRGVDAVAASEA